MAPPPPDDRSTARRGAQKRYDHRSRQHESAHAHAGDTTHHQVPEHPMIPRGSAPLITTDRELAELLDHVREMSVFAYDSEFIGELTYHPKLCLIQVATSKRAALVDPLAGIDLKPFWETLADPNVRKIVHAGQQDVEPVVRHLKRGAANIFDTQIAAGFMGLPYPVSLTKLVQELTGAKLGKGLTFTHWDQRPLSSSQLRYAVDDVRYLPLVHDEMLRRLDVLGHTKWALEECQTLTDPNQFGFNPDAHFLRIRGANSLSPANLAVLRALTIWRDENARRENVPPRTFLRDEVLLDMARSPIKNLEKLSRVRGLPRPVEHEHGNAIVELTARALATPSSDLPTVRDIELAPVDRFRSDALWSTAEVICSGQSIDPALVTSRQEMSEMYRRLSSSETADDLRLMKGWRREAVGEKLVTLYRGKDPITLRWSEGSLKLDP
ncbi:MAG TPA: ribonuclease D, partial [Tepidisphaeraceae bacterium]|jgi:ribonuclease D|nr:ribonuclease D [Tepidisphaeraceae bacterium]